MTTSNTIENQTESASAVEVHPLVSTKNPKGWWLKQWGDTDRYDLIENEDEEHVADCVYGLGNAKLFLASPELLEIVKAVAHIGIDWGYGEFQLEDKHIDQARKLYESLSAND